MIGPVVIPAKAGIHDVWISVFTEMAQMIFFDNIYKSNHQGKFNLLLNKPIK